MAATGERSENGRLMPVDLAATEAAGLVEEDMLSIICSVTKSRERTLQTGDEASNASAYPQLDAHNLIGPRA